MGFGLPAVAGAQPAFVEALLALKPHPGNPVFEAAPAGSWDARLRERGWILKEGDLYHLWYTGYLGAKTDPKHLGYATSRDGLVWERHAANPILPDRWIEDVTVVKTDDRYTMIAEGEGDRAQVLESRDATHWTPLADLEIRRKDGTVVDPPYGTPAALHEKGTWFLFYEKQDAAVWLATSTDRIHWTNVQDDPVLSPGPEPYDRHAVAFNQVLHVDGKYHALYHASDTPDWKSWTTCLASSEDKVHWTKSPANPILKQDESSGIAVHEGRAWRLYTMHGKVRAYLSR